MSEKQKIQAKNTIKLASNRLQRDIANTVLTLSDVSNIAGLGDNLLSVIKAWEHNQIDQILSQPVDELATAAS